MSEKPIKINHPDDMEFSKEYLQDLIIQMRGMIDYHVMAAADFLTKIHRMEKMIEQKEKECLPNQ